MDFQTALVIVCSVAMVVGLVGIVVPVLPGLLLCWAAVLVWAIFADVGNGKWIVLVLVTLWTAAGEITKYLWPGRRLKRDGVPNLSLLVGLVLGVVGFFVIPIVGLPVGFVAGVWLAEARRFGGFRQAWPSTLAALKATGLSILIELGAGGAILATWIAGLLLTG